MNLITLLLLAAALGTDAFSLSIGIGMAGIRVRQIWVISITVLIFHICMPLTGYFIGEAFSYLGSMASVAGALVLVFLGLKMTRDSLTEDKDQTGPSVVIANTLGLVLLAFSVSLDALSVGFTLVTQDVYSTLAAGVIGVIAGLMTASGLVFGKYLGEWIGSKAEALGGIILIGIGIRLFL